MPAVTRQFSVYGVVAVGDRLRPTSNRCALMPSSEGSDSNIRAHAQQVAAPARVFQTLVHIREQPARALDAEQPVDQQTCVEDFRAELFRAMKVGRGEVIKPPGGVAVLPVADVCLDDRGKRGVAKEIANQTVQR